MLKQARRRGDFLVLTLLLTLAAGCATPSAKREGSTRRALRPIPAVSSGYARADRALIAAFFSANGVPLVPAQLEQILPTSSLQGRIDRNAIRQIATKNKRLLMVVKADEEFLWDELGNHLPLLILLPSGLRNTPAIVPLIPVAWDRGQHTIDLLDGNGEIQTFPEADFFARRKPLKHAALCLIKPGALRRFKPTRDQKLLLADFWFDQGAYRRAHSAYAAVQKESPVGETDLAALVGRGNVCVRQGRYKEAVSIFRAALVLDPDNSKILNNLAYSMLNDDQELLVALRHATKAAQLSPDNPVILETLGSINLRLGEPLAAAKYLEQAWARALKRSPEIQIAIMDQLVRAWYAADRKDLAWQVAEHRHRSFPDHAIPRDLLLIFSDLRLPVPSESDSK